MAVAVVGASHASGLIFADGQAQANLGLGYSAKLTEVGAEGDISQLLV